MNDEADAGRPGDPRPDEVESQPSPGGDPAPDPGHAPAPWSHEDAPAPGPEHEEGARGTTTPTLTAPRDPRPLELPEEFKRRLEQHYLPPGVSADDLAAEAALRRAGHKGRHHFAGHASGRAPHLACGEYRPVAGNDSCPVCPHVCPSCGARYVTPFPIDPRDMR